MKNRDQLLEHYEDALLAVLMDSVAESEGKNALLLNESLLSDPAAAVPDDINERMEKTIHEAYAQKRNHYHNCSALKLAQRAAIVALLGILTFTIAFSASEEFRVGTLNAIIDVFDTHSVLSFQSDPTSPSPPVSTSSQNDDLEYHYNIATKWIPDGLYLDNGWTRDVGHGDYVSFRNKKGGIIDIHIYDYDENTRLTFDTEDRVLEEVTVRGFNASLYTKTEEGLRKRYPHNPLITSDITLLWINDTNYTVTLINANNLTKAEILLLAEGIYWNGE